MEGGREKIEKLTKGTRKFAKVKKREKERIEK